MRLIDADKMRDDWLENGENEYVYDTNAVLESIDAQPTVDAAPVVHGKWLIDEYEYYDCSVCGQSYFNGCDSHQEAEDRLKNHPYDVYSYCPYCGAKMDK